MRDDELHIKKIRNGTFILYNKYTGGHSHFRNRKAAATCRRLLIKGIMPKQPYFRETARRVLTDDDWESLRQKKQKDMYININKGVKQ